MRDMKTLRVGSRDSELAVIQARQVMDAMKAYNQHLDLKLVAMKTTGDIILDKTLDEIGGKGLFVKELDHALLEQKADITVHSFKDMPMELNPELPVIAAGKREDPRDVLILRSGAMEIDEDKPIGCSSARRRIQLKHLYPNTDVQPVRGNIQTRLRKLDEGQFSALILAAAGIRRLGLEHRISRIFEPEEMLPAACQGIIAVQARAGETIAALAGFADKEAMDCAMAERAFVRALGGGCSSPVAAYARYEEDKLILTGMYVSPDGSVIRFDTLKTVPEQACAAAIKMAEELRG